MQYLQINGGNVSDSDRQLFISDVHVVANNTERDALTVQTGDVCKVTGDTKTYIYDGVNWIEIAAGVQYTNTDVSNYLLSILTTSQDLLFRNAAGNLARLNKGANNQILSTSTGGLLVWTDNTAGDKALTDLTDVTITTATTGQVLYKSAGDWVNQTLKTSNVTEETNLYYTTARQDDQMKTYFSAKGKLLAGTGASTYDQVAAPDVDFKVLVSDITNVLTTTGMVWNKLALNSSYFSNISATAPTNGQVLAYQTGTGTYTPTNSLGFPLLAPNGTAVAPSYSFVNFPNTGFYADLNGLRVGIGGVNHSLLTATTWNLYQNLAINGITGLPSTVGGAYDATFARMYFQNGGGVCALHGDGVSGRINGVCGNIVRFVIDNTATKVMRLDVLNTQIHDSQILINTATNTFQFKNAAATSTYLTVNTTGNSNVVMPLNRNAYIYYDFAGAVSSTTVTVANTYVLFSAWPAMNTNIAGSLITVANPVITVAIAGRYHVTANCYVSINDAQNIEIKLSKNGSVVTFYDGMYALINPNNTPICAQLSGIITFAANDTLQFAVKSPTDGKNMLMYGASITLTNLFNT